jgi:hypothetical protein
VPQRDKACRVPRAVRDCGQYRGVSPRSMEIYRSAGILVAFTDRRKHVQTLMEELAPKPS